MNNEQSTTEQEHQTPQEENNDPSIQRARRATPASEETTADRQDERETTPAEETPVESTPEVETPEEEPTIPASREANELEDSCRQQLMRVTADFANFKRRVEKERAEWFVMGEAAVLKKLLTVVDDIDRAVANVGDDDQNGLGLIAKKMHKMLADLGVKQIDCSGEFDPVQHEALMQVESESVETGEIVDVMTPGYVFKGQVLRAAQVSVSR